MPSAWKKIWGGGKKIGFGSALNKGSGVPTGKKGLPKKMGTEQPRGKTRSNRKKKNGRQVGVRGAMKRPEEKNRGIKEGSWKKRNEWNALTQRRHKGAPKGSWTDFDLGVYHGLEANASYKNLQAADPSLRGGRSTSIKRSLGRKNGR